ncbi:MAG: ABC transporter ATP-binding protein [Phycisphaerales bacterium]|nr:ABC transporter ATP-binding protein [Phycisphaerales bacterium]
MSAESHALVRVESAVVEHRSRRSKPVRALDAVSFTIEPGAHVALLGPNGSGKSTLLRVIAGLQALAGGSIQRRPDLRFGVVFQSPALDPLLTVRENLRLQAALSAMPHPDDHIENLCAEHGLEDRLSDRVKTLSGGLARRVEFVRAILGEPDLLLLDEPSVGLDLPARAALLGAIEALRTERPEIAVVMSTHLMTNAERFERVLMMSGGAIVREGSPVDLVGELGSLMLGVPAHASVDGVELPWEPQPDGSRIALPDGEAQLRDWSASLADAGIPFFVRKPTLADAYLRMAGARLDAELVA